MVAVLAGAALAWVTAREGGAVTPVLLCFLALAAVADAKEVRLPVVGVVGMSFVPVLTALIALGLWPAMVVALAAGATSAGYTRDPMKIGFNLANYALSTFLAGVAYRALLPADGELLAAVVPAFAATTVDFFANTLLLAGVVGLATGEPSLAVWQRNYRWALPGYLTGATLALGAAWLFLELGVAGLLLALPPLALIYFSYDIYVSRVRERASFDAERDTLLGELAASLRLHEELREAQLKVAAEIERARRIQTDLLPAAPPTVAGMEVAQRIEFLAEMGGDYFDYLAPGDGRTLFVCGDVMGKGLAAALIMAMTRSLLHAAARPGAGPGEVLAAVNDGLARDLAGQRLPCFVTLAVAAWDPGRGELVVAGGGHTPLLLVGVAGVRRLASQGAALGVREGLVFPEETVRPDRGDLLALYTDGLTEARSPEGDQYGVGRLEAVLARFHGRPACETLDAVWDDVAAFRRGRPAADDATLILCRCRGPAGDEH